MARTVFLLSPASVKGLRARQMMSPRSNSEAGRLYRSVEGVPLSMAFTHMSALYFRGKIGYALQFAPHSDIFVITPGFGLVPHDWRITEERMRVLRKTEIGVEVRAYRKPLERDAKALAETMGPDDQAVILGSVATGKYVDILLPIFGERLRFPSAFAGLGDMARGGLMLRATRAGRELEYTSLAAPRHRPKGTSGKMPPLV